MLDCNVEPCSGKLKMLLDSGNEGYNATLNLHTSSWDTWHPLFTEQAIFYFHMSIVKHFCNKILSAQRNTHIIQILCRVSPKRGLFRGDFLFVGWKRHGRVRSVFFI